MQWCYYHEILFHLSKEEQRQRFLRRLETEKHNWKFSPGDLKERELWNEYTTCYEESSIRLQSPTHLGILCRLIIKKRHGTSLRKPC